MKLRFCPQAKRTRERIKCNALGSLCIHQYYKQCKGIFELTEAGLNCPIAKKEKEKWKEKSEQDN